MGNTPSSSFPNTSEDMGERVVSRPLPLNSHTNTRGSTRRSSTRQRSRSLEGSSAPPPYTPVADPQEAVPPPVPPREIRRTSSAAVRAVSQPQPRPHRRTASHSARSRPDSSIAPVAEITQAPGDGVGGFLAPNHLVAGSRYTTINTARSPRHEDRAATRTNTADAASHSVRVNSSSQSSTPSGPQSPFSIPIRRNSREDPLQLLRKFDTVIIVDDSSSMEGPLWFEARNALAGIAEAAARYNTTGIDLHFLNDRTVGSNLKSARDVERIFDSVIPEGITPTGEKLEELLLDYLLKFEAADQEKPKPVNFVILTDGAPTDDPESVIVAAAKRLDAQHAPIAQIGVQFVQLGSDPDATEALKAMDDGLSQKHNIRDMVDTTLYTGQILTADLLGKILLGGINRRVDERGIQLGEGIQL